MAKKKITTQIKMRVVLVSLEFALAVSLTDCFVSLSSFACCVSWCKDLPEFALINIVNKLFHFPSPLIPIYDQTTPSGQYYPQKNGSKRLKTPPPE
ncbi:hypothetical protein KVS21_07815 [Helicobacter pylori]|nr:hypothetical protein KVS21_07815 [Helicobacter pylori]